jgi:hypothetical protein
MTKLWRSIFAVTVTLLLVTADGVSAKAATRAGAYDGEWSVVIQTLRGDCAGGIRVAVRIAGSRVLSPDPGYDARGVVASNGAIRVVVSRGDQSANGSGRLTRDAGHGWWRTVRGECSGQWAAERRGAW